jgi:hypothetical protein
VTSSEQFPVQQEESVSRGTNRELTTTPTTSLQGEQEDFADYLDREGIS